MTQEEAIRRIKARFDKWALDDEDMKAIQTLIPELCENKDEKIREFLIGILSQGTWRKEWPFSPNEVVAYLERQNHVQSDTEKEYVKTLKSLIFNFLSGKDEVDRDYYQQIEDWLDGRHIEQKEQKSTNVLEDAFKYYTDRGITISCGDFKAEPKKEQKPQMTPKWLYRLEFKYNTCGLWYDGNGKWCLESGIGSIDGCKTKTLPMDYDERYKQDGRNWFSSCSKEEDLLHWYSLEDAKKLISNGFVFTRYLATEYHEYEQQTVFIKETSLYREELPRLSRSFRREQSDSLTPSSSAASPRPDGRASPVSSSPPQRSYSEESV